MRSLELAFAGATLRVDGRRADATSAAGVGTRREARIAKVLGVCTRRSRVSARANRRRAGLRTEGQVATRAAHGRLEELVDDGIADCSNFGRQGARSCKVDGSARSYCARKQKGRDVPTLMRAETMKQGSAVASKGAVRLTGVNGPPLLLVPKGLGLWSCEDQPRLGERGGAIVLTRTETGAQCRREGRRTSKPWGGGTSTGEIAPAGRKVRCWRSRACCRSCRSGAGGCQEHTSLVSEERAVEDEPGGTHKVNARVA